MFNWARVVFSAFCFGIQKEAQIVFCLGLNLSDSGQILLLSSLVLTTSIATKNER